MPLLAQSSNTGHELGATEISTSAIRNWVQNMKNQEGGRAPDIHKVNGNMAWHERKNSNAPIYQLYKSMGKDSAAFLKRVKSAVPSEFPGYTPPSDGNGGSGSSSTDDNNGSSANGSSGGNGSEKESGSNGSASNGGNKPITTTTGTIIPGVKNQYLWYGCGAALVIVGAIALSN